MTDKNTNKSKGKRLFEIKKETIPKYFTENSINNIIKRFDINKELKLKLLLDTNVNDNEIEQIKRVLEKGGKDLIKIYTEQIIS